MRRTWIVLGALTIGLWLVPVGVGANGSLVSGYGGSASAPVVKVEGASASSPSPTSTTLPFTGLDVVWFAVAGGALVLVGLGLRRRGTNRS